MTMYVGFSRFLMGLAAIGFGFGAVFGAGVAVGHTQQPKAVVANTAASTAAAGAAAAGAGAASGAGQGAGQGGGFGGGAGGGGAVTGSVDTVSATSMTVKTTAGESVT